MKCDLKGFDAERNKAQFQNLGEEGPPSSVEKRLSVEHLVIVLSGQLYVLFLIYQFQH